MNGMLAVLVGVLISVMIGVNGVLSARVGNFNSTIVIHASGLLSMILVLFFSRRRFSFRNHIPLYIYSAGIIGVMTVVFNNISFNKLGVSLTIAMGLLGQSLTALAIDQFGWFGMKKMPFDRRKLAGFALIAVGIIVMTIW